MYGYDSDLDIVEEREGYRVRLELDTDPQRPDYSGQTYVLQLDSGWDPKAEGANQTFEKDFDAEADDFADKLNRLFGQFGLRTGLKVFERYLRIFHGTRSFAEWNVGIVREYGYISFDTEEWRERQGLTDEYIAGHPDIFPDGGAHLAEETLLEYERWVTGEVYGVIVEKNVNYTKQYDDPDMEDEEDSEWVEVEDCWGYSGREYAEQAARESLANAIPNLDS